ncbi:MAG: putative recombinase, partial [Clostridiales bacterium]|nr:putative recombinase [Clostridiales bacterium]
MEKGKKKESTQLNSNFQSNAAAYLRVSSPGQEKEGYSLDFQRAAARKYAETKELILNDELIFDEVRPASKVYVKPEVQIDEFESSLDARPRLKELIEAAEKKKFKHLIVFSRDRISRDVVLAVKLNEK